MFIFMCAYYTSKQSNSCVAIRSPGCTNMCYVGATFIYVTFIYVIRQLNMIVATIQFDVIIVVYK